jgi:hypothetical protein
MGASSKAACLVSQGTGLDGVSLVGFVSKEFLKEERAVWIPESLLDI